MGGPYYGQKTLSDDASEFHKISFAIRQALSHLRVSIPVKVIAVKGGGLGAAGTVDVQPMVKQMDGVGNSSSHGKIYGVPVARIQGGLNAIICDPQVGDFGIMLVADRDISSVKNNKGSESNPASLRRHDFSDGIYIGAILNPGTPNQYVQFTSTGINISDKNGNTITTSPAGINLNGLLIDNHGNVTTTGNFTANGIDLEHHTHGGGPPPDPGS